MKRCLLIIILSYLILSGCSPKSEPSPTGPGSPLPTDTWSQSCVELSPYQGINRLRGMCCSYVTFPNVSLDNNRSFSVAGTYYTFNGAGYINYPVTLSGKLSADATTLTISYSVNGVLSTYTLKPGQATASCYCGCD